MGLYPPRGSNPPPRNGRGVRYPLYYDEVLLQGTVYPPHTDSRISPRVPQKLATACDTPCAPPHTIGLLSPPDRGGTSDVGGVPAGLGWPAHPPIHCLLLRYDYTRGAKEWGPPLHLLLPEAAAKGQSLGKAYPATSTAGGASRYHHTHTCCPSRPEVLVPSEQP